MLKDKKVRDDKSDISAEVEELNSLISRDNSLEVYDDKSDISAEVRDWTTLISRDVSLLRSEISVLSVENVIDDKSSTSLLNALLKSTMSVEREV